MKLLLDHCMNRKFARHLSTHEVKTAGDMGWEKLKNGDLLAEAANSFDVLITVDKNIRREHNLLQLPLAVLELDVLSQRLDRLLLLLPHIELALQATQMSRFVSLHADGTIETLP